MPILTIPWLSRPFIRQHPRDLFIFGDNMARQGFGGQAKECRGEPNVVGIVNKWRPTREPMAYFSNQDFVHVQPIIDNDMHRIKHHLTNGGIAYFPAQGIGTGLAMLELKAPLISDYINARLKALGLGA